MWDSKRDTDVKNSLLDSVGEGEAGMIWEGSVEMCMLSYVKWINHWSRLDASDRMLRDGALGWPWGMGWGERWEGGSGWGAHIKINK